MKLKASRYFVVLHQETISLDKRNSPRNKNREHEVGLLCAEQALVRLGKQLASQACSAERIKPFLKFEVEKEHFLKMAVETNWKNFLSEDSELPPDVSIRVKGDKEEGGQIFRAHETLLAGMSPVFRKQFFGPMKETMEVVEVKETTPEAFGTLLN